ncbi:MAG: 4-hydroxybenzoate octaprenyltransferase [Xanthobacteraceae bacterium]|nr:4-hydroxybenzoate octaprenyltransferase [Xanthobacteraceae bacterium]MCW5673712.1 4-hydroxybenzoate octaprenyltransferase [Xanthobacteraceae bacterium]
MTDSGRPAALPVADSTGNWVDRGAPGFAQPFLRLARIDRPIGWWLLLLPCWWSTAIAALAQRAPWPDAKLIALFLIGAIVMRGAGSTWNDILDRKIDAQVERTKNRPIPSGQVSAKAAFVFAIFLSFIGLAVLLQMNRFAILTGAASLLIVAVYPLAKRVISMPQLVLGFAFSWGALMGWAAVFGALDWRPVVLYAGTISWVIGYDTIYAHQDRRDDAIIGVKSSARLFGKNTKPALTVLYAITVLLVGIATLYSGGGIISLLGLIAFAAHLAWQVVTLDADDPSYCLKLFRANRDAGLMLFAGFVLDVIAGAPFAPIVP